MYEIKLANYQELLELKGDNLELEADELVIYLKLTYNYNEYNKE